MSISKKSFGVTKDGKETFLYTINNKNGMKAAVSNFGPAIQRSADGSSNSRHATTLSTLPTRFNTSHGQRTASEGLLSRLTLQEGS